MLWSFDTSTLVAKLSMLTASQRTVFAALCSERQLPLYDEFHQRSGRGNPVALDEAMDFVWSSLGNVAVGAVQQRLDLLEPLMLDTDDPECDEWLEYASDAVISVHATLRSLVDTDVKVATFPARAGYRIADAHVLANIMEARGMNLVAIIDPEQQKAIEEEVLRHEIVQRELRQQADNLDFAAHFSASTPRSVIDDQRRIQRHATMLVAS